MEPDVRPDRVPSVRRLLTQGLQLSSGVPFPAGADGAGRSTVEEAVVEVGHQDHVRSRGEGCLDAPDRSLRRTP